VNPLLYWHTNAAPPIKGIFIFKNMGCDIHFHTEVKIKGRWHHHSEGSISRNYVLFTKMAGVRDYWKGEYKPISEPKGLPKDATFLTRLHSERYGSDGHSHSWLNADEIVQLHDFIRGKENPDDFFGDQSARVMWAHHNLPYFMGDHMDGFKKYPEDYKGSGVQDVRYVFFFDN